MKTTLSLIILSFITSSFINAQGWGNYDVTGNFVGYTYGNNTWNGPSNLFYYNSNSCGYSQVLTFGFPLSPCNIYGHQLYTGNYMNGGWNYSPWYGNVPVWFWAAGALINEIGSYQQPSTTIMTGGNNGRVIYINGNNNRHAHQKYDDDGDPIYNKYVHYNSDYIYTEYK